MATLKQSKLLQRSAPNLKKLLAHNTIKMLPDAVRDKIPPSKTSKKASILVPIIHVVPSPSSSTKGGGPEIQMAKPSFPSLLFTKRSSQMNHHANEISFPGGHVDDQQDDHCVIRAALRETREELSPATADHAERRDTSSRRRQEGNKEYYPHDHHHYDFDQGIQVLGTTTESIPSIKNIPVTPVLAYFRQEFTTEDIQSYFPGNESEVSKVFTVPIDELVRIEGEEPLKRLNTVGPVYHCKDGKIWGLTALVLKAFLDGVLKPTFMNAGALLERGEDGRSKL